MFQCNQACIHVDGPAESIVEASVGKIVVEPHPLFLKNQHSRCRQDGFYCCLTDFNCCFSILFHFPCECKSFNRRYFLPESRQILSSISLSFALCCSALFRFMNEAVPFFFL